MLISLPFCLQSRHSLPPLPSPTGAPNAGPAATSPPDIATFLTAIPERLSQAITLYSKMLPPLSTSDDHLPVDPDRTYPLVYAEACLRNARFLLAVWESGGWIEKALERLITPPPNLRGDAVSSAAHAAAARTTSMAPSNTVPRSSIAQWVSMAYSPQLATLPLPLRLRVTGEISSIFAKIGYRRKESFVLREIAALCGEGVAGKGIEVYSAAVTIARPPSAIEEEDEDTGGDARPRTFTRDVAQSPALASIDRLASIVRTTSDTQGNASIIRVAEKVCEAFGIQVVPRGSKEQSEDEGQRQSLLQIPLVGEQERVGWPALQVGVLHDAILIAEALPGKSHPSSHITSLLTCAWMARLSSGYSLHCYHFANTVRLYPARRAVSPQPEYTSHFCCCYSPGG